MKSEFVAMVSHDLRAPLSVMQQQIQVLLAGMAGPLSQRQKELLEKAARRADGLIQLIGDLIDLAKIEAGRAVDRRELVDIRPVVETSVEGFRELATARELELSVNLGQESLCVIGDREALGEVFSNLLSNAISHTPEGGKVMVCGFTRSGCACVEVVDTGIGIPPHCIPRIFDKFFRVRDERSRDVAGTGLGLPIVKGIVEAHLGAVEVESTPGKGSTFGVLIPLSNPSADQGSTKEVLFATESFT